MTATIKTMGAHHIGLTVANLARVTEFFTETLGFDLAREVPDYPAVFVSDGAIMITLWQAADPATATPFDRKTNIGLHHLALRVADAATLAAIQTRLEALDDVEIEFAPEPLRGGPVTHMMCLIPGGIRMEFIAA